MPDFVMRDRIATLEEVKQAVEVIRRVAKAEHGDDETYDGTSEAADMETCAQELEHATSGLTTDAFPDCSFCGKSNVPLATIDGRLECQDCYEQFYWADEDDDDGR